MNKINDIDLDGVQEGGYSGTFRWKKDKKLPLMPTFNRDSSIVLDEKKGWMTYFTSRNKDAALQLVVKAQQDLSLVDCLSTPISLSYFINKLKLKSMLNIPEIHIVCIGVSSKAEGRVFIETNCWNELSYFLGHKKLVNIWFVGPEMEEVDCTPMNEDNNVNLCFHCYNGTAIEFFRSQISLLRSPTIVIGLNCGFGNWENLGPRRYNLLKSWLPDLFFLTSTSLPLIFTCANHYADLRGELLVMYHILGAQFLVKGEANPFGYASTFIPPGVDPGTAAAAASEDNYSRGNSFWYAVQGFDRSRRRKVDVKDPNWLTSISDVFLPSAVIENHRISLVELSWRWHINAATTTASTDPSTATTPRPNNGVAGDSQRPAPTLAAVDEFVASYTKPALVVSSPSAPPPAAPSAPATSSTSSSSPSFFSLGPLPLVVTQTVTGERLRLEVTANQSSSLKEVDVQLAMDGREAALLLGADVLRIPLLRPVLVASGVEGKLKGKGKELLVLTFCLSMSSRS